MCSAAHSGARPRIAVFFQRPLGGGFHGATLHAGQFFDHLGNFFDLDRVVPPAIGEDSSSSPLQSFAYVFLANLAAIRYVLGKLVRPRQDGPRAVVLFDFYSGLAPWIWSRVCGLPFVYYALDDIVGLSRIRPGIQYRGLLALRLLRTPLENLFMRQSFLVLVPSSSLADAVRARVGEDSPVRVCPIKRLPPKRSESEVKEWAERLELGDRPAVVFVGNLSHPPNRRAADFIVTRLMTSAELRGINFRMVLLGVGTERIRASDDARIAAVGPVDSLSAVLFAARVGIAPMDTMGGTSGKLVDYLIHGLKAVATPEAAIGVEAGSQLITATLEDFPKALRAVLLGLDDPAGETSAEEASRLRARYLDASDIDEISTALLRHLIPYSGEVSTYAASRTSG